MKISSIEDLYNRVVITLIQIKNNINKIPKFHAEHTEHTEQL